MAQHFLLSAAARTISLGQVLRMSDAEAEAAFAAIRWPETAGRPVCPGCGCPICYDCRRPSGAAGWRCQAWRRDFSLTSGTLFAFHKLGIREYLAAVVVFCDEVKGKSALALSRDLDIQYKTAFVLEHKIREAMGLEFRGLRLGGAGRQVEVDGAYFGGHVRPENRKEDRKDRRLAENKSGKRQVVVVIRERALAGTSLGGTLPAVFVSEDAAMTSSRPGWTGPRRSTPTRPRRGTPCMPASTPGGSTTRSSTPMTTPAPTGRSPSSPGRAAARSAIIITSPGSTCCDTHESWPGAKIIERDSTGLQVRMVVRLVVSSGPSVDFCGYWQRARPAA